MTEEIWKDITGYEGLYQVSNLGRVKSYHTGKEKLLKQRKTTGGYVRIVLYKDGNSKYILVHRLVAHMFIPNPNNYPIINHKDENPKNNCVDNLEWCSFKYNVNYGTGKERMRKKMVMVMTNNPKKSIPIKCFDLETNETTYYPSINEAERQMNISKNSINYSIFKSKSPYKNRFIFTEINK